MMQGGLYVDLSVFAEAICLTPSLLGTNLGNKKAAPGLVAAMDSA